MPAKAGIGGRCLPRFGLWDVERPRRDPVRRVRSSRGRGRTAAPSRPPSLAASSPRGGSRRRRRPSPPAAGGRRSPPAAPNLRGTARYTSSAARAGPASVPDPRHRGDGCGRFRSWVADLPDWTDPLAQQVHHVIMRARQAQGDHLGQALEQDDAGRRMIFANPPQIASPNRKAAAIGGADGAGSVTRSSQSGRPAEDPAGLDDADRQRFAVVRFEADLDAARNKQIKSVGGLILLEEDLPGPVILRPEIRQDALSVGARQTLEERNVLERRGTVGNGHVRRQGETSLAVGRRSAQYNPSGTP